HSMAFTVQHLDAWYGRKQALFDINLSIEPQTVTAMIGPSGCGKSTFIRCLNRMHEEVPEASAEGKVLLENVDIYRKNTDPVAVRRKIGMVFQKPNPFPSLSVFENTVAGLKLAGVRRVSLLKE